MPTTTVSVCVLLWTVVLFSLVHSISANKVAIIANNIDSSSDASSDATSDTTTATSTTTTSSDTTTTTTTAAANPPNQYILIAAVQHFEGTNLQDFSFVAAYIALLSFQLDSAQVDVDIVDTTTTDSSATDDSSATADSSATDDTTDDNTSSDDTLLQTFVVYTNITFYPGNQIYSPYTGGDVKVNDTTITAILFSLSVIQDLVPFSNTTPLVTTVQDIYPPAFHQINIVHFWAGVLTTTTFVAIVVFTMCGIQHLQCWKDKLKQKNTEESQVNIELSDRRDGGSD